MLCWKIRMQGMEVVNKMKRKTEMQRVAVLHASWTSCRAGFTRVLLDFVLLVLASMPLLCNIFPGLSAQVLLFFPSWPSCAGLHWCSLILNVGLLLSPLQCAGNVSPYSFFLPPNWVQQRIANILSGNYCQPKCAEPWIEVKFDNPKQGTLQVHFLLLLPSLIPTLALKGTLHCSHSCAVAAHGSIVPFSHCSQPSQAD
jgi:hypothetical protein